MRALAPVLVCLVAVGAASARPGPHFCGNGVVESGEAASRPSIGEAAASPDPDDEPAPA